jgi:hypothetical protein
MEKEKRSPACSACLSVIVFEIFNFQFSMNKGKSLRIHSKARICVLTDYLISLQFCYLIQVRYKKRFHVLHFVITQYAEDTPD